MATLVASSSSSNNNNSNNSNQAAAERSSHGSNGTSASTAATTPESSSPYRVERPTSEDEVIEYLREHFVPFEPILASLNIDKRSELDVLLKDLVKDCLLCSSTNVIRDEQGKIEAVCLASKATLFESQMDRLCCYEFKDIKVRTAVEFLKYVFNRADVQYHLEESRIMKPVFIALVGVKESSLRKGMAKRLLDAALCAAREDRCDGALALCSSARARPLLASKFAQVLCRIRYCDYRGEFRDPPIVPPPSDDALLVMLAKL